MRGQVGVAVRARIGDGIRRPADREPPPGTDELKPLPGAVAFLNMGLAAAVCVGAGVAAGALGGQRLAYRAGPAGGGARAGLGGGRLHAWSRRSASICRGGTMSMMSGLSDLEGTALAKVLRRTVISALIVGIGAPSSSPCCSRSPGPRWGSSSGSAMAILNLRFLDAGVAKVQTKGETEQEGPAPRHGHQERDPARPSSRSSPSGCCS